ncbi:hypothetical protein SSX86_012549 [Deinandra increscens subsp. villosa]|uniref:Beta-carotene isomerase D27-like C-terminal domain-containing protein n=1 Tax=Deinandra increscens subsp. villosa TaxID=3103831 RepID=A0AAP0D8V2_9ASTR
MMAGIVIFPAPVTIGIAPSTNQASKRRTRLAIVSVITPSSSSSSSSSHDVLKSTEARSGFSVATNTPKTVYKDNWFDRLAIDYLSKAVQNSTGMKNEKSGYESLVVAAKTVFRSFTPIQQRQLVAKAIQNAIPPPLALLIKTLMPPSKFSRAYFATFTTIFFRWLVGPCEVKESEFEGSKERNIVYIKKCRLLESTNCAGICTNLCKIPSQEFIKNSFGIPVNMVPNFDDMSCQMIYGENPPALEDDPALKQPCYKLCDVKHKHDTSCLDEEDARK